MPSMLLPAAAVYCVQGTFLLHHALFKAYPRLLLCTFLLCSKHPTSNTLTTLYSDQNINSSYFLVHLISSFDLQAIEWGMRWSKSMSLAQTQMSHPSALFNLHVYLRVTIFFLFKFRLAERKNKLSKNYIPNLRVFELCFALIIYS